MKKPTECGSNYSFSESAPTRQSQLTRAVGPDTPENRKERQRVFERIYRIYCRTNRGRLGSTRVVEAAHEFVAASGIQLIQSTDPAKGRFRDYTARSAKNAGIKRLRTDHREKARNVLVSDFEEPGAPLYIDRRPSPADTYETARRFAALASVIADRRAQAKNDRERAEQDNLWASLNTEDNATLASQLGVSVETAATRKSRYRKELLECWEKKLEEAPNLPKKGCR